MSWPLNGDGNVTFKPYERTSDEQLEALDALLIAELNTFYLPPMNVDPFAMASNLKSEKLIISTPNADYLPKVNLGHQNICMCIDGCWGAEDWGQWPQWYFDGQEHFAYILRQPAPEELKVHPLRRLWTDISDEDFEKEPESQVGRLRFAQELYDIRKKLMEEVQLVETYCGASWSKLQSSAAKMRHCTSTLLYTPLPYFNVIVTNAAAQRYCLETRALLDKITKWDVRKYSFKTYPPADNKLMGCITDRLPVVYDMYEKGVPVWFVRPLSHLSKSTNIRGQGLVIPPSHFGIETKHWCGAPAFYQGRLSGDMTLALENWRPGCVDLNLLSQRTNSEVEPPEESSLPVVSSVGGKGRRTKPYSRAQASIQIASKKPNISVNLELFQVSRSPYMPRPTET